MTTKMTTHEIAEYALALANRVGAKIQTLHAYDNTREDRGEAIMFLASCDDYRAVCHAAGLKTGEGHPSGVGKPWESCDYEVTAHPGFLLSHICLPSLDCWGSLLRRAHNRGQDQDD